MNPKDENEIRQILVSLHPKKCYYYMSPVVIDSNVTCCEVTGGTPTPHLPGLGRHV